MHSLNIYIQPSRMSPSIFEMTMDCNLRTWLTSKQISGVEQYLSERNRLFKTIVTNILVGNQPFDAIDPAWQDSRAMADAVSLDLVVKTQTIKQTLNLSHVQLINTIQDGVIIDYFIAKSGTTDIIFTVSLSKQWRRDAALPLILSIRHQYDTSPPPNLLATVLMPLIDDALKTIRYVPKEGKLTKAGVLDSRDVGTWAMIHADFVAIQGNYMDVINNPMPDPHLCGDCMLCQYHNVPIILPDGTTYQCIG